MEWKKWQHTSFKLKDCLPSYSGIYIVADKDDCVWYVGQAKDIQLRMTMTYCKIQQLKNTEV